MKKKLLIGILMGLIGISMPFYTNATIPDIAGADPEWITESDEIEYCNRDIVPCNNDEEIYDPFETKVKDSDITLKWNGIDTLTISGTGTIPKLDINSCGYNLKPLARKVIIEEGISGIDKKVFNGWFFLESVDFPESLRWIGGQAFSWCPLENVVIPDKTEELQGGAFAHCYGITKIDVPDSVNTIGSGCFMECITLKDVKLPANLKDIPSGMFRECTALESIVIPDSVTEIGFQAFCECEKLSTVKLPSNLEIIDRWAFIDCPISELTLPTSVKYIGDGAFDSLKIKSLYIPENVIEIGEDAFKSDCLEEIVVDNNNRYFDSRNGCNAIIKKDNNCLIISCKTSTIPEGVEELGCYSC